MKLNCRFVVAAAVLLGVAIQAAEPSRNARQGKIGIYDSRAVAVAFAGSEAQKKWMAPLMEEHKKASAAGDSKRVKELEAEGKARQKRAHQQAFSTAPVDDILEHIKDQLPEIRKKAGLPAEAELVSKWDKEALKRQKDAEQIDVTADLVDAFKPNEKQRKAAHEIQQQKPITGWRAKMMD